MTRMQLSRSRLTQEEKDIANKKRRVANLSEDKRIEVKEKRKLDRERYKQNKKLANMSAGRKSDK